MLLRPGRLAEVGGGEGEEEEEGLGEEGEEVLEEEEGGVVEVSCLQSVAASSFSVTASVAHRGPW